SKTCFQTSRAYSASTRSLAEKRYNGSNGPFALNSRVKHRFLHPRLCALLLIAGAMPLEAGQFTLAPPANLCEGDPLRSAVVRISESLTADLSVSTASSNPGACVVPSTVTIPAGQTQVVLPIT